MTKHSGRLLVLISVCLCLSGCTLTGLGGAVAPDTFDLTSPDYGRTRSGRGSLQLMVAVPTAVRALETDRILVKPGPERISYYGRSVWSDRLPQLLQVRLVEALQSSGHFRAVASSREKIDPDLGLAVEIRAFQIEVSGASASAHIDLFLKIIDDRGRAVASSSFEVRVPAAKDDVASGVASLNDANQVILKKIVRWVSRSTEG